MIKDVPAELSIERVGRHCPHCVLRVKEEDVERVEFALFELSLHLLFEEDIEGGFLGFFLSSKDLLVLAAWNVAHSVRSSLGVDYNAVSLQLHSLSYVSQQSIFPVKIDGKFRNQTNIGVSCGSNCIHGQESRIPSWYFDKYYVKHSLPTELKFDLLSAYPSSINL